ncbi:hypothetical protein F5Y18DRAFT_420183 [Xylariaceae sp. FL1019]|nr:hypothetical protein F5Y18DRAFT_420183 [Xylariaceae sp. FL1019]
MDQIVIANGEPICSIITPVGMFGDGFDEVATWDAVMISKQSGLPTALILDSGSTDGGPSRLALGLTSQDTSTYLREMAKLLYIVHAHKVPLIISSVGGVGTDEHVHMFVDMIRDISAQNDSYFFRTLTIFAELEKDFLLNQFHFPPPNTTALVPCGSSVPEATELDIRESERIVAQMGPEPFLHAMNIEPNFDIIIAGRAFDPSPYIAYACHMANLPVWDLGRSWVQLGGFAHMGKIMECGGACATPKCQGAIATVYRDGTFDITPLDARARCTPVSVAANALWYGKERPDISHGPGGWLDMTSATYTELDGGSVRVHGAQFHYSIVYGQSYLVKLEGAKTIGHRSIFMGSFKDPILIGQLDSYLSRVKAYVKEQHSQREATYDFDFHIYPSLRSQSRPPGEVFVIGEAIASSQMLANEVASTGKIACIHGPYAGQKANAGNFAFGIGWDSGLMTLGLCPQWSLYHLLTLGIHQKYRIFRKEHLDIGEARPSSGMGDDIPQRPVPNASESRGMQCPPNINAAWTHLPPGSLGLIASVVRSKNAGPFEITFDVMFDSKTIYEWVKDSGFLTYESAADALGVPAHSVTWAGYFDPAQAFKITVPKHTLKDDDHRGCFMEHDVHNSQHYLPLMYMRVPDTLMNKLTLNG